MHQSHWGRAGLARAAYGHAVSVRMTVGIEPAELERALDEACDGWWGTTAAHPQLWIERVDSASTSADARRHLDRELNRPMGSGGPLLRVLLLEYSDDVTDLVLVADRRDLDPPSLAAVAEVLLGKVEPRSLVARSLVARALSAPALSGHGDRRVPEVRPPGSAPGGVTGFEWAVGGSSGPPRGGSVDVPLGAGGGDVTTMVAVAAGLVMGRYEGLETVPVAVWSMDPGRSAQALGGYEQCAILAIDASDSAVLQDVLQQSASALQHPDRRCALASGAASRRDGVGEVAVGVLDVANVSASHYVPCQSPPFPLTFIPVIDEVGEAALRIRHRLDAVDTCGARQFGRHVAMAVERLRRSDPTVRHADLDYSAQSNHDMQPDAAAGLQGNPRRIDDLFRERACERPHATAVVLGHRQLTYAELDEQSARLARGLRACGVAPGDRIGICLDRSVELIVTMLAVLEAGAAFVPMDVRHPADRLVYTAGDAGVRLVVTGLRDIEWGTGKRAVSTAELEECAAAGTPEAKAESDADAAAYVIYTSGSTGRPKGVVVPHRNVHALLDAAVAEFDLGPDDAWSLFHSSAFDFSVWEIWGALLTGGRLIVVPYWISRSPVEFHTLLAEQGVSVLSQTPTAFTQLAAADQDLDRLDALRLVVFGGESLDTRTLLPWLDRYPESRCRLVNMYGTTETTVHVTAQTVTRRLVIAGARSVGHPLRGWLVDVLDARGRRLPSGLVGEIYVGGAGVALGYLNRPDLTDQRFVCVPARGNRRMYRTGDRGRLRRDGTLEHLGRLDNQVQIRGFRIELDEVRAVLLRDPAVAAAAVISDEPADTPAGPGIDAYVVLAGDDSASGTASSVRARAATFLPDYMLPRTVTVLESLPLTINGKLDTARLPPPPSLRPLPSAPTSGQGSGTGDSIAETLTDIWESLLGVPVALEDNLFELGGNSLCAIKADSMMRRLGLPVLPMRELYLRPSIREICETLERLYPSSR
ncbi:amino acid adenylation domain-containing protein [Rhodococcus sp. NPDC058514]|uniref:amino acid adenylation domain-containing protein n=1 Tax=unclassified Rhodococcus (in: high G+C Gram-positive bacteria) TaxID=192944 RepID=UPI003660FCE2